MITLPDLKTAMLDILHEIRGTEIKLIIGSGFGIYFKNRLYTTNENSYTSQK